MVVPAEALQLPGLEGGLLAITYPDGYGNTLLSIDDLRAKHTPRMHPEFASRLFTCIEESDGLVGIGNGWRSRETQAANHARAPNTFAPPGKSFHESHPWASGIEAYAAVDTVGRDNRHDEAWDWMRDNAGRFGLRTFWNVNGEPWHTQCNDLPNGVTSWNEAGSPDPGGFAPATRSSPVTGYGLYPLNTDKPMLSLGWHGDMVVYVQSVIRDHAGGNITVDGDFGPKTDGRVRDLQSFVQLAVTGTVDWTGTWQIIDHLAGNTDAANPGAAPAAPIGPPPDVVAVDSGRYWMQRGDSPIRVTNLVYGAGSDWNRLVPTTPAAPGFGAADHLIELPGIAGVITTVRPGDRAWSLIGRLCPGSNPAELLDRFQLFNGGPHRVLQPGDVVFIDRPLP